MNAILRACAWILVPILLGGCESHPKTAAELMREFKGDAQGSLEKYKYKTVTFTGEVKKPPWEKAIIQHEGGSEALIYFVTGNPDEWFFCDVKYERWLNEVKEGDRFLVTGTLYHFESAGKLFLTKCSLKKLK